MKKEKIEESGGKRFISGVFVLSFSTLIVKVIGLAFKIPMLSILGMEGMGYFNSAYEIYAMLCVVSTAGLPVALSILVSAARAREDVLAIKGIYRSALRIFFIFGALGSAFMILFAKKLAMSIGNDEAYYCIMAIAPALFFICLASAVRGYCQGFEEMKPTAISQLIEAIAKLVLGIIFALAAIRKGYPVPTVAAFAVLGITVGTFLSLCYLMIARRKVNKKIIVSLSGDINTKKEENAKTLLKIALPITLGSAVISLTRILDMAFIMRRLQDIGISSFRSNEIYGAYTTLALPIFGLIPSLITPVSMALIPELTGFIERKSLKGQIISVERAIRLTTLFAMPASLAVTVFSRQILSLLFKGQNDAIDIAAPLLSLLGASVLFSCLITTTNAILQAYRCVKLPIFSMSVGVAVKAITSYFLLGSRWVGVYGAPIGNLACNVTVVLLNFALMFRYAGNTAMAINLGRSFVKPFFASVISIGGAFASYSLLAEKLFSETAAFCIAVAIAVILYCLLVFLLGIMDREDLKMFPIFNKILKEKQ